MTAYLADENFPHPSYHVLVAAGLDIRHVSFESPSISDVSVIRLARLDNRVLLTLDRDHGKLIFRSQVPAPAGVVYFRIVDYRPSDLGPVLLDLLSKGVELDGYFTVVDSGGFRQRPLLQPELLS